MDQVLIAAVYFFSSSIAMICVAIFGYFMAQMWVEATNASKIQSPVTEPRGRAGPVWEVRDGDESDAASLD